jgi:hypothetical protein
MSQISIYFITTQSGTWGKAAYSVYSRIASVRTVCGPYLVVLPRGEMGRMLARGQAQEAGPYVYVHRKWGVSTHVGYAASSARLLFL